MQLWNTERKVDFYFMLFFYLGGLMFYMVNPSPPPKRKKKKSKRRNPELLIVNPYELGEEENEENTMARKRKSRKSRRRKNPLSLYGFYGANPAPTVTGLNDLRDPVGFGRHYVVAGLGGGALAALTAKVAGSNLPGVSTIRNALASFGGDGVADAGMTVLVTLAAKQFLGGLLGGFLSEDTQQTMANGALTVAAYQVVNPWLQAGFAPAGFGAWTKEGSGFGYLGQSVEDEYSKKNYFVSQGAGFGDPVVVAPSPSVESLAAQSQLQGFGSYEAMGNVYAGRLGSLTKESITDEHGNETCNPRDQQCWEQAQLDNMAGGLGGFAGFEGATTDQVFPGTWSEPHVYQ